MKRKTLITIVLLCFFTTAFAFSAYLDGDWVGNIKTPDGKSLRVTYNFKVTGNKLIGTAYANDHEASIRNGKIVGKSFKFQVTVNGYVFRHIGKIYANSCSLDIYLGGQKVHATIRRIDDEGE